MLEILKDHSLGKKELAVRLGRKAVSGALSRLIQQLLEDGLIEMTIPEKPNSRLQKYRLASGNLDN